MNATASQPPASGAARGGAFLTTHWSVVLSAQDRETARAREALARLCQAYWYPLYAYVRRRGHSPEDSEDLTQGFFARLFELNSLADVRREKGRFRSFLLGAMNHYLADQWDRDRAKKRGAGKVVPLEMKTAETRYRLEPTDQRTPEKLFERQWAVALLQTVLQQLEREYAEGGKGGLFSALSFSLTGERSTIPYAELALRVGMSESAVRVAVHRLRHRYRQLLRAEIAHTVSCPEEIEEELRYLWRALAG